jgi:hypothetical protein
MSTARTTRIMMMEVVPSASGTATGSRVPRASPWPRNSACRMEGSIGEWTPNRRTRTPTRSE